MQNASIGFLFISTVICLVAITCSNQSQDEAMRVWQAYVDAVRAGDTAAVRAMYTPESQEYFAFYPEEEEHYRRATYKLFKARQVGSNVELQVIEELQGQQTARFYYLVKSGDQLLLQYPFLIFAKSWPTQQSTHFTIHKKVWPVAGDSLSDLQSPPDTVMLESLWTQLSRLTGRSLPERIDYYVCSNEVEAAELAGIKGKSVSRLGRTVIANSNVAIWDVAYVALASPPRPCSFLTLGLIGWASFQVPIQGPGMAERFNQSVSEQVRKLEETSLSRLVKMPQDSLQGSKLWVLNWVVGALTVKELFKMKGDDVFRTLYENSSTAEGLQVQLDQLYGVSLEQLQSILISQYLLPASPPVEATPDELDTAKVTYEELKYPIKDLGAAVLNIRYFKSRHCFVACGSNLYNRIGQIVAISESAYQGVSSDFAYDYRRSRPYIVVPNPREFAQMTDLRIAGAMREVDRDSSLIFVNGAMCDEGNYGFVETLRHELTHYVLHQVVDKPDRAGGNRRKSSGLLHHGICCFEEPRGSRLPKEMKYFFPDGHFLTIAETDTVTSKEQEAAATEEYCVLVGLLVEKYGRQILPKLARQLQTTPVPALVEQATGRPWPEIEQQWMDRMRQLVSSS